MSFTHINGEPKAKEDYECKEKSKIKVPSMKTEETNQKKINRIVFSLKSNLLSLEINRYYENKRTHTQRQLSYI
jgi:hypothetical protein